MRYGLDALETGGHGDRLAFPAQSSVLDEEALLHRVVCEYMIPAPARCRFFSRGDSDVYRVFTAPGRFYLKVYRPPQTRERCEAEAEFVVALASRGVRVVRPIRREDGTYASVVTAPEGARPILLFEEAPGGRLFPLNMDVCRQLGSAIAQLHQAADDAGEDRRLPTAQSGPEAQGLLPYAEDRMTAHDYGCLERVNDRLQEVLAGLPTDRPDFGLCHNDLVLSNVRRADDGHVVFFDFGNAAHTWRAFELATVYGTLDRPETSGHRERLWNAVLEGYAEVRPVPTTGREVLPYLRLLRKVRWLPAVLASCPLRMGDENFSADFVAKHLAGIRALIDSMPEFQGLWSEE